MAKAKSPNSAGVPMMITKDMERRLRDSGLDQTAIDAMTPQQAHDHLNKLAAASDSDVAKGKRHRSPNYPFINLEKAIERTKQIYEADRRHDVPLKVISEKRWGYTAGSSQGDQTMAALRSFGLVDISGTGDKRMARISDRAYRILAGAQDAAERVKDAALAPTLHGELWQKYGTNGLPSKDVIRNYLLFERELGKFNEDVVDGFIDRFEETISFAKLGASDKISTAEEQGEDDAPKDSDQGDDMESPVLEVPPKKQIPPPLSGQKDFPLYLSNNRRAVLYIPASMTAKDYELLKKQLENHLMVIEATSISDEEAKPN